MYDETNRRLVLPNLKSNKIQRPIINAIAIKEWMRYRKLTQLKWIALVRTYYCEFKKGGASHTPSPHARRDTHGLPGLDMSVCGVARTYEGLHLQTQNVKRE